MLWHAARRRVTCKRAHTGQLRHSPRMCVLLSALLEHMCGWARSQPASRHVPCCTHTDRHRHRQTLARQPLRAERGEGREPQICFRRRRSSLDEGGVHCVGGRRGQRASLFRNNPRLFGHGSLKSNGSRWPLQETCAAAAARNGKSRKITGHSLRSHPPLARTFPSRGARG